MRKIRRLMKPRRAILLLPVCVLLVQPARARAGQEPRSPVRVACIGNSITYGDGIQDRDHNSYPAQLQRMLGPGWEVKNFGVGGATLLRKGDHPYRECPEYAAAKAFNPDVVVIKLGTNDSKPQNWRYAAEFEKDYLEFVDEFQALPAHPKIFLCEPVPAFQERWGIRDSVIRAGVIPLIMKIVRERNLSLIDLRTALSGRGAMFPDAIHPDAAGAGIMARVIRASICPECPVTPPPAPFGPLPSGPQLRWQNLEYCAFIHFTINTFTGREWGDGSEDPKLFNPTRLDCRQWARVCRNAGMKGIIITAKHHDGFCLWPSRYTDHSVKNSPFRNGHGDVLRELSDACHEYGLDFGIYVSPWDRHEPSYGDSARYNEFFRNQLREVLTSYGRVFEVWFDGACGEGPNGRRQVYDWPGFFGVVRQCQPDAVIFSDGGPDIRWVGDEEGYAGETNWSLLRRNEVFPGYPKYKELTSGHANGTDWVPAECDVSIRPGWFYHPAQDDSVKSLNRLIDIYFASVGRNGSLLLNVPVDRRGLIPQRDADRLKEFREFLDEAFAHDLARGASTAASNIRGNDPHYGAENAVDADSTTYWATDDTVTAASMTFDMSRPTQFNCILLREFIPLGQRVEKFSVDASAGGKWERVAEGTTIGHKRLFRIPLVAAEKVRLMITRSRACPAIADVGLYLVPDLPGMREEIK